MNEPRRIAQRHMASVYILKSVNFPKTYVGSTVDIDHRLKQHNEGRSTFSTLYKPWIIVYREEYGNLIEARKREKYFKSAAGRRYIKKFINIPR